MLLVVDNCEHLLDAAAHWLVQILGVCQQPTILATSRSPLDLPGESRAAARSPRRPRIRERPDGVSVGAAVPRARAARRARRRPGRPAGGGGAVPPGRRSAARHRDRSRPRPDDEHRRDRPPARRQRRRARPAALSRRPPPPQRGRHHPMVLRPAVADGGRALRGARRVRRPLLRLDGARAVASVDDPVAVRRAAGRADPRLARHRRHERTRDAVPPARDGPAVRPRPPAPPRRARARPTTASPTTSSPRSARSSAVPPPAGGPGSSATWSAAFDDLAEALRWCTAHDSEPRRAYALCATLWGIVHQGRADDIADLARRTLARWPDQGSSASAQCVAALATAEYVTGHPERALELVDLHARPPSARPAWRRSRCAGWRVRPGGRSATPKARSPHSARGLGWRTSWACRRWRWSSRSPPPWSRPTAGEVDAGVAALGELVEPAAASGSVHHRDLGSGRVGAGCCCGSTRPPRCR